MVFVCSPLHTAMQWSQLFKKIGGHHVFRFAAIGFPPIELQPDISAAGSPADGRMRSCAHACSLWSFGRKMKSADFRTAMKLGFGLVLNAKSGNNLSMKKSIFFIAAILVV